MPKQLKHKRILVKFSGEAFGQADGGIDPRQLKLVASELKRLLDLGVEAAVVVGAGNIWRKRTHGQGLDPTTADYLGLLATVMNGLALQDALKQAGIPARLQSPLAWDLPGVEKIDVPKARGSLRRKQVVVFAGGTGKPFFTTDTAAAQRAHDVRAELIIKAGPVDGVYTADPNKVHLAKKFKEISISEALRRHLQVMDREAFALCLKYRLPVVVCRWQKGALARVVQGKQVGTLVRP